MPDHEQQCLELESPAEHLTDPCKENHKTLSSPWPKRVLKAPYINRSLFAEPDFAEIDNNAIANHRTLSHNQTDLLGCSLSELRSQTRKASLKLASEYTGSLREESIHLPAFELLFCTGHQPAPFHPGVWCKNIAVSKAARHSSRPALSLNLIVDQDLCGSHAITVPIGKRESPATTRIPFDARNAACPWEERHVKDCNLFASFGERVSAAMAGWQLNPLLGRYWPLGVKRTQRTQLVSEAFTAMRHSVEQQWGLDNLELPLSLVCQTKPFYWFTCHLLANLHGFQQVYNEVLTEYRQVNRIRSRTHPVPALSLQEDWREAPYWVWRTGESQRKPLYARHVAKQIWLSDGKDLIAKLSLHDDGDATLAVEQLAELAAKGIRLRTRALTTTLFARLFLADMFVHGIGGSKYDEMTDQIMQRFYRLKQPMYQTLTATLHLPFTQAYNVSQLDLQKAKQQLRDLKYNSDRHLSAQESSELARLCEQKLQLIQDYQQSKTFGLTKKQRQARHPQRQARDLQFRKLQQNLAARTHTQQAAIQAEIQILRQQLAANHVIKHREFAYCLYPEEYLNTFFEEIFPGS